MTQQRIQDPSTWYSAMARRLGISRLTDFILADVVSPVAIVDSYVTLTASAVPALLGVPATAGEVVAPAAAARLADTGALAAGNWTAQVMISANEGLTYRLKRRDAADAADVWSQYICTGPKGATLATPFFLFTGRFSLAANERLVVETIAAGTAALVHQASIWTVAS